MVAGNDHNVRAAHLRSGARRKPSCVRSRHVLSTTLNGARHIYVPLRRTHEYHEAAWAARRVADMVAERDPDLVTTEFLKKERRGRVFLDFTRIGPGKHMAAAYSVRARPGAPVSFPVRWEDLERVYPTDFTIRTVPPILKRSDPWKELCPRPQALPRNITGPGDG